VNTLSPGNVWTPLWESCANECDDPAKVVEAGNDAQLNGRMGTIEEMGKICLFLAAEATFCTGIGIFEEFDFWVVWFWEIGVTCVLGRLNCGEIIVTALLLRTMRTFASLSFVF